MPTILDTSDLRQCANIVLSNIDKYFPEYSYYFHTLNLTGCRPLEPLKIDLWSFKTNGDIQLNPLKHNNPRTFNPNSLPSDFVNYLISNNLPFNDARLRTLLRTFHKMNSYGRLSLFNDGSALYLFRYLKAKEMYDSGLGVSDVHNYFGWKHPGLANRYIEKVIYLN
jgi:hypothetical protein